MFSIIMPVWNRADTVRRAVESVLRQTFREFELVIVDDGSDDGLETVLAPYLAGNVRFFRTDHRGVSAARNLGIRQARHEYIAYLDSDNEWHPGFLERMRDVFADDPACRVAYCMIRVYEKDPVTLQPCFVRTIGNGFSFEALVNGNYIDMNALVHGRDCFEHTGFHDETLKRLVDWEFVLRLTSKYRPCFVPEALVDYYLEFSGNTITGNQDPGAPLRAIQRRNHMHTQPVRLVHDSIEYVWDSIPDEKYDNWVRMNQTELNTRDFAAWGYPYMLQIEPTSLCNLSCPLCPTGRKELNRPYRHMSLDEFKSIIDDMEQYLLFLVLWDWGEPLMNPELPAMIRYASERGIKTVTSTNAYLLNDEAYARDLLGSGLSTLIVAVDSIDPDNYEVYRRHGALESVLSGLDTAVSAKRQISSETLINVRMVVMKQNELEINAVEHMARQAGADVFTLKTLNPSCGVTALDEELLPVNPVYRRYEYMPGSLERVRSDSVCRRVWTMSNIFSNGDVVPCCYDYDSSMKAGNAFEKPFPEIWNSAGYREIRKRI